MSNDERKVAIVTGSATGVGAAAAIMLAERNCNVVINYTRSKDDAEETAATCRAKGVEAITFQADVSEDDDCRAMVQATIDAWGRIDYLINNAARTKFNPFPQMDGVNKQDFLDIYAVNVVGPYQMIRAAEPHMRRNGGAVVNDSSIGRVTGIRFDSDSLDAVVTFVIDSRYDQIPDDSDASILTAGLLGSQYIGLQAGGSFFYLEDGSEILFTQSAIVLENIIGKFLIGGPPDAEEEEQD